MSKVRVLLVIRGFHNGGIEKVFENYFSHMDLSPFEIHIVTHMQNLQEKKKIFEDLGCTIHEFSALKGHRLTRQNYREYKLLFQEYNFDVVHNNMPDNLLPLWFARRQGVKKRILHAHNIYNSGLEKKNKVIAEAYKTGFKINTSLATDLIAVSYEAGKSAFGPKVNQMFFLPNAIDFKMFQFNPELRDRYRKQLGLNNEVLIGNVGRFESDIKNQDFALQIFLKLLKQKSDYHLIFLGDGKRMDEIKNMAAELNIADKVTFTGNVFDVPGYLSAMDLFVLPSKKEGLSVSTIEAQVSGLICLVSDMVPKEVKISDNLIFLPITDAGVWVNQILEATEYLRRDNNEAIKNTEFNINNATDKLVEIWMN